MYRLVESSNPAKMVRGYVSRNFHQIVPFAVFKGYTVQFQYTPEEWAALDPGLGGFFRDHVDTEFYQYYGDKFDYYNMYFKDTKQHIVTISLGYSVNEGIAFDNDEMTERDVMVVVPKDLPEVVTSKYREEIDNRNRCLGE